MLQADIFWSLGIGFSFFVFADDSLKDGASWYKNEFFITCICFMSMIFAPCGTYLVNQFPIWETFFVFTNEVPPIVKTFFTFVVTFLAILGFYIASRVSKETALTLYVRFHVQFFAVLGFGYSRMLYTGSGEDWFAGKEYPISDFFTSEMCYTILVMYPFIVFVPYYFQIKWFLRKIQNTYQDQLIMAKALFINWLRDVIVLSGIFLFYYYCWIGAAGRESYRSGNLGPLKPLGYLWAFEMLFPLIYVHHWLIPWQWMLPKNHKILG